jgi:hypothetical protein
MLGGAMLLGFARRLFSFFSPLAFFLTTAFIYFLISTMVRLKKIRSILFKKTEADKEMGQPKILIAKKQPLIDISEQASNDAPTNDTHQLTVEHPASPTSDGAVKPAPLELEPAESLPVEGVFREEGLKIEEGAYKAMKDSPTAADEIPSKSPRTFASILSLFSSGGSKTFSPTASPDSLMKDDDGSTSPFQAFFCAQGFLYALIFIGMAAGMTSGAIKSYRNMFAVDWDEQLWVGFVGSSYFFVNDIPRLMEVLSDGQIMQDSCLHTGGSLAALVMTGNGMYNRWRTNEAAIQNSDFYGLYDYGACSVHQLISGRDYYLAYGNGNKAYYDDGTNPCLVDGNYFDYVTTKYTKYPPRWDYIVLADQTKRMATASARYDSVDALLSVYAPLLNQTNAIPVIVDTHAFWSNSSNMTGLYDVPTFTRMVYEGVEEYMAALESVLPPEKAPIIVPIGLAYLTVWEENYEMWQSLFLSDNIHSSLSGSYLFACVLYTKLFGHLPKKSVAIPEDGIEYLFGYSRKNLGGADSSSNSTLTAKEAQYLLNVAKRVVLNGHVPSSFLADDSRL